MSQRLVVGSADRTSYAPRVEALRCATCRQTCFVDARALLLARRPFGRQERIEITCAECLRLRQERLDAEFLGMLEWC